MSDTIYYDRSNSFDGWIETDGGASVTKRGDKWVVRDCNRPDDLEFDTLDEAKNYLINEFPECEHVFLD